MIASMRTTGEYTLPDVTALEEGSGLLVNQCQERNFPLQYRPAVSRRSPVPLSRALWEYHQTIILRLRRATRNPRFFVYGSLLLRPANATKYLAGRVDLNGLVGLLNDPIKRCGLFSENR